MIYKGLQTKHGINKFSYVNNMGGKIWWYKGWAMGCNLGISIIIALHLDLYINHIPRCSCKETLVADAIYKGDYMF